MSDMNVLEKVLQEIDEREVSYKQKLEIEVSGRSVGEIRERLNELNWIAEIIRSHMDEFPKCSDCSRRKWYQKGYEDGRKDNGWIPVEEGPPEDDRYILLSFENFSLPLVGRYEENEKGGAFYLGDCDEEDTCISNDLYVNAWTYLPERYKGDSNA